VKDSTKYSIFLYFLVIFLLFFSVLVQNYFLIVLKQVEKLSRSDEQSAFSTGGVSNVAKFSFFLIGEPRDKHSFLKFPHFEKSFLKSWLRKECPTPRFHHIIRIGKALAQGDISCHKKNQNFSTCRTKHEILYSHKFLLSS
jgi:hypothetical protein